MNVEILVLDIFPHIWANRNWAKNLHSCPVVLKKSVIGDVSLYRYDKTDRKG